MNPLDELKLSRRKFMSASMAIVGASAIHFPVVASAKALTIAQVIDQIKKSINFNSSSGTVDTVKSGNPGQAVSGIVTTMFATVDVIRKAASLGANLIIAHEPT